MDDPLTSLVLSFIGAVVLITCGAFVLGVWLLYLFCVHVLPPLATLIGTSLMWAGHELWQLALHLHAWWRRVTWRWRIRRLERRTVRRIERPRRWQVTQVRRFLARLPEPGRRTPCETAAVRSAVGTAVRSR